MLRIRRRGGLVGFARVAAVSAMALLGIVWRPCVAAPSTTVESRNLVQVNRTTADRSQPSAAATLPAVFEHRDFAYDGLYGLPEAQTVQLLGGSCTAGMYQIAWKAAGLVHVPPSMVAAVIEAESGCRGGAISAAGAHGLMQLIPEYGGREAYRYLHGRDHKPSQADLRNPRTNIELGVSYLSALQGHYYYVKSQTARGVLALAAYNWGPEAVDRRLPAKHAQGWDGTDAMAWVLGNTPAETRSYVGNVLRKASIYDRAIWAMHVSDRRQATSLAGQ